MSLLFVVGFIVALFLSLSCLIRVRTSTLLLVCLFLYLAFPVQRLPDFSVHAVGINIHASFIVLFVLISVAVWKLLLGLEKLHWIGMSAPFLALFAWTAAAGFIGYQNRINPNAIIGDLKQIFPYFVLIPLGLVAFSDGVSTGRKLAATLLLGVGVHGYLAIVFQIQGPGSALALMFSGSGFRIFSLTSVIATWALPLAVVLLMRERTSGPLILCAASMLPGIVFLIILSGSRTMWAVSTASVITVFFMSYRRLASGLWPIVRRVFLFAALAFLLLNLIPSQYLNKQVPFIDYLQDRSSLSSIDYEMDLAPRGAMLLFGVQDFFNSPLWGQGLGWYWWVDNEENWCVDNIFVTIAVKMGVVGLALWIWLFWSPVKHLRLLLAGRDFVPRESYGIAVGLGVGSAFFFLEGFNMAAMLYNPNAVICVAFVAAWIQGLYSQVEQTVILQKLLRELGDGEQRNTRGLPATQSRAM